MTAFFAHWRLVIFVPVTCAVLTLGACILFPPLYSGGFSLLVKAPEIDRTSLESVTSVVMRPGLILENVISDEIKILQSHELFLNVAETLIKEKIEVGGLMDAFRKKYLSRDPRQKGESGLYSRSNPAEEEKNPEQKTYDIEALAGALQELCVVTPVKGSDIIEVSIQHYDPQAMQPILDQYLRAFYRLREAVWFNSNAADFFQASSDNYYRRWQDLLDQMIALKQKTTVLDPAREKDKLEEKQAANTAKLYDLQATVKELQSQLDRLKTLSPEQSLTFLQEETIDDKLFRELKLQIASSQAKRAKLLGDFSEQAAMVRKTDYQLDELHRKYYRQLFALIENKIARTRTRMAVMQAGLVKVKQKLLELTRYANQIQLLEKKIELHRKHYFDHGKKAMEVKLQKDLRKMVATVNVVSQPFVNSGPDWPKPKLLVPLAFTLGMFLTLSSIVFMQYMKDAYQLPEEISRDLNLPVLASFSYRK